MAMAQTEDLPRYRKVLIATDGSDSAWLATKHGVALARALGAEVLVVYVVDIHQAFRLGIHAVEGETELAREGQGALDRVIQLAGRSNLQARGELVEGDPKEVLVDLAADEAVDCLVVGAHGKGLARAFLGSVSEHCARNAACPVLVVPELDPGATRPQRQRKT